MARNEIIDGDFNILNVDEKVGLAKPNGWGDVVIVQALMKYIREGKGGERGFDFLHGEPSLRNPDGFFHPGETDKQILAYQKASNRKNFGKVRLKEDGVIGHAKGKSGWAAGNRWTIVDLNTQAQIICLALRHGNDHIKVIQEAYPQVRIALNEYTLFF